MSLVRPLLLFACISLLISGMTLLGVLLGVWYLARYHNSFELVVVAMLYDGYYGAFNAVPWATVTVFVLWSGSLYLKERLLVYTKTS